MKLTKEGYIDAPSFCEEHDYPQNAIYVKFAEKHPLIHKSSGRIYVDYNGIVKRHEFRKKVWLESHDAYWEFLEYFGSENKFATWLAKYSEFTRGSWVVFLATDLFAEANDDLFGYKVPKRLWFFWRATKMVLRYRDRRIKRIYDLHPALDMYDEIYKERGCKR